MKTHFAFMTALCVALTGCSDSSPQATTDRDLPASGEHDRDAGDQHPEQGPHQGELIELGQEDYHAEMVHGEETFSIYILDAAATDPVAVAAEKLTLSLKKDGRVKTFELTAARQPTDPEGQSSHFSSSAAELHQWLDEEAEGALTVQIGGKSFTGQVAHDHDAHDH